MSIEVFTGFNNCWDDGVPDTQTCPNCGEESLTYREGWKCERCHRLYEPDTISTGMKALISQEFTTEHLTFKIHHVDGDYWLECIDDGNRRFQYLYPFERIESAIDYAADFKESYTGDATFLPANWHQSGWGNYHLDVTIRIGWNGEFPTAIINTGTRNDIPLWVANPIALYRAIVKACGLQIFHPHFQDGYSHHRQEKIPVDLDNF